MIKEGPVPAYIAKDVQQICSAPQLRLLNDKLPEVNARYSAVRTPQMTLDGTLWAVRTKRFPYKSYTLIAESPSHKLFLKGYTTLEWDDNAPGISYEVPIDDYLLEEPLIYSRSNAARLDIRSRKPVRRQYGGVTMARVENLQDRLTVPEAFRVFHGFTQDALAKLVAVEPVMV